MRAARLERQLVLEAEEQPRAIGIAAAGRIHDALRRRGGHVDALPALEDRRAVPAARHDDGVGAPHQVRLGQPGPFQRHGPLVVVDDVDARALEEGRADPSAIEVDQLLARVDHGRARRAP